MCVSVCVCVCMCVCVLRQVTRRGGRKRCGSHFRTAKDECYIILTHYFARAFPSLQAMKGSSRAAHHYRHQHQQSQHNPGNSKSHVRGAGMVSQSEDQSGHVDIGSSPSPDRYSTLVGGRRVRSPPLPTSNSCCKRVANSVNYPHNKIPQHSNHHPHTHTYTHTHTNAHDPFVTSAAFSSSSARHLPQDAHTHTHTHTHAHPHTYETTFVTHHNSNTADFTHTHTIDTW